MGTNTEAALTTPAENVVPFILPKPESGRAKERFRIIPFTNAGKIKTKSWRVTGSNRQGKQIRENFAELDAAKCRQAELLAEYYNRQPEGSALRATKLTDTQLRIAETSFIRLNADEDMLLAVELWLKHDKEPKVAESKRLDEAVTQFKAWLPGSGYRARTRANLKTRVDIFANSVPNLRLADISPDTIFGYLEKREVSRASKDNDRRVLSRFFAYCIEPPRRWISRNPARKETRERRNLHETPPAILSLNECQKLLKAAESHRRGRLAPYVAVCLFGGLRPFEAARLGWSQVNLKDRQIRLEANQTKTGRSRVIAIDRTLRAWLKAYENKPFFPKNWRKDFDIIKATAGFGNPNRLSEARRKKIKELKPWPGDVMRHTAISHYFRKSGSYGLTAEWAGNSESIIKRHYQGRVSTEDTKKFYGLKPTRKAKR